MKKIAVLFLFQATVLLPLPAALLADSAAPYSGQENRAVKSLSADETRSLLRGDGMGFAKLAELNHYPGPRHVLDVASELELTPAQLAETETLFVEMKASAIALGNEIVRAESALDKQFAGGGIDETSLESALMEIGRLQARLRFVHLNAHLQQRRLLSDEQVRRYDATRGYGSRQHDPALHHHQ